MSDEHKQVEHVSYCKNMQNGFLGFIIGLIMVCGAFALLWGNEEHNAKQLSVYHYIDKYATVVSPDKITKLNNNKLIAISSPITSEDYLTDDIITIPKALVLFRKVEMYQWKENKNVKTDNKIGGSSDKEIKYSYSKVWSENEIISDNFYDKSHINPPFVIKSEKFYAQFGDLGLYTISIPKIRKIDTLLEYSALPLTPDFIRHGNMYYKGDITNPKIGDVRILYYYAPSGTKISIIGKQQPDSTIDTMYTKAGPIYLQYNGLLTKNEMLLKFKHNNIILVNILRLLGFILMFAGICAIFEPLIAVLNVIPPLADFVSFLTGGLKFIAAVVLSMLTIAVAWLTYRPLIGLGLLLPVIVLAVYIIKVIRKKQRKLRVWEAGKDEE